MSEEEIRKIFSKNLTHYLSVNGKTQKDLINYIHVSSSTASNWCTGQKMPRMDKIQSICNWLQIGKSDLLEDKNMQIQSSYNLDNDVRDMTLFLRENPEYKVLFDATRKIPVDDIDLVKQMLDRFTKE